MSTFKAIERAGKLVPHPFWLFWYLLVVLGVGGGHVGGLGQERAEVGGHFRRVLLQKLGSLASARKGRR